MQEDDSGGVERAWADFDVTTDDGTLRGEVAFVRADDVTYRVMGYAAASNWTRYASAVGRAISSFDRVTDREILDVQPLRLDIVTLSEPMSLNSYVQRNGSPIEVADLARLNRTSPGAVLSTGTKIKRVVGEPVG